MDRDLSLKGGVEMLGHEGIVTAPYYDSVGVLTWGGGHTRAAGRPYPSDFPFGEPQPIRDVIEVFLEDAEAYGGAVNRAVDVAVARHEFDALVSFHYNTGGIARARLTRLLNAGDRDGAADAFMGWTKPPEIAERRRKEQSLFRTGSYSNGGWASVYPADGNGRVQWSRGRRVDVMKLLETGGFTEAPMQEEPEPEAAVGVTLFPGTISNDVRHLQRELGILADGIYGRQTRAAVTDYQYDHGLLADGVAGPQTLGHMGLWPGTQ